MKRIFVVLLFGLATNLYAQTIHIYFETIKDNAAELTVFFSQMPKGGDLHHHYSGSIYTKTYVNIALENNFYINRSTLEIRKDMTGDNKEWVDFSSLKKRRLAV